MTTEIAKLLTTTHHENFRKLYEMSKFRDVSIVVGQEPNKQTFEQNIL
ncbi:12999_t:CDS:1, partial [Ambispora leptoticha]